jgi:NAD(P)-dependent dehydrogenase (short-subunit alcohol dehydrogenase family)
MSRSAVLVTGGNSGIGFECARELARNGWHVVIASRDRALSQAATRRIAAETGNAAVSELGVDLGSTQSVRDLVWEIDARDLALRALVCNAGLQSGGARKISADGYELTFAVNHLGHFLLANLLLQRLLANAPARIVVVSSGVHDPKRLTGMPKAAVTDMAALAAGGAADAARFNGQLAYVNSKLCNMWFAYELDRRLAAAQLSRDGRLTVNAFDPGLVPGSGLARDYTAALRFAWNRVLPAWRACCRAPSPASARRASRVPRWRSSSSIRRWPGRRGSTFRPTPAGGRRRRPPPRTTRSAPARSGRRACG